MGDTNIDSHLPAGDGSMTATRVAELFGPTFQGEGPSTGRPAMFVRLWGCNLDCAWCDTPYTWDTAGRNGVTYTRRTESATRTVANVLDTAARGGPSLLVITGGEPLLQRSAVAGLITGWLAVPGQSVEVETNGTQLPVVDTEGVRYNVSPKVGSASTSRQAVKPDVLRAFINLERSDATFKFVATSDADLAEAAGVVDGLGIPSDKVWIMPEGRDSSTLHAGATALADRVLAYGFNLTTRLQVHLWGDTRGT